MQLLRSYLRHMSISRLTRRSARQMSRLTQPTSGVSRARTTNDTANDVGSLIDTVAALVITGIATTMIVTVTGYASRVDQQEVRRSEALRILEANSFIPRRIDCIANYYKIAECRPPDQHDIEKHDPITPIPQLGRLAADKFIAKIPAGIEDDKSGHPLIEVEWIDYYLTSGRSGRDHEDEEKDPRSECDSKAPPRAVREITVKWVEPNKVDTGDSKTMSISRTILGPSVPATYGWATVELEDYNEASLSPAHRVAGLEIYSYKSADNDENTYFLVPSYGVKTTNNDGTTTRFVCKVIVAPAGSKVTDNNSSEGISISTGWNDYEQPKIASDPRTCDNPKLDPCTPWPWRWNATQ